MKSAICMLLSAAVGGFLLAPGQVHAQGTGQDLSEQEVRTYLDTVERDMVQAMRAGEYQRLVDWTEANVADEASFLMTQELHIGDERKGFFVMTLDKEDMLGLSRIMLGMMSEMPAGGVEDYALDIEVVRVVPLGPDAATATTRMTETGRIVPGEKAAAAPPDSQPIAFEATARCSHVIRRDGDAGRLVIGMSNCEGATRF